MLIKKGWLANKTLLQQISFIASTATSSSHFFNKKRHLHLGDQGSISRLWQWIGRGLSRVGHAGRVGSFFSRKRCTWYAFLRTQENKGWQEWFSHSQKQLMITCNNREMSLFLIHKINIAHHNTWKTLGVGTGDLLVTFVAFPGVKKVCFNICFYVQRGEPLRGEPLNPLIFSACRCLQGSCKIPWCLKKNGDRWGSWPFCFMAILVNSTTKLGLSLNLSTSVLEHIPLQPGKKYRNTCWRSESWDEMQ